MKRYLFVMIAACFISMLSCLSCRAVLVSSSGLEVDNYKVLPVIVKEIPDSLVNFGLTKELVMADIERRLSQRDISAITNTDIPHFLYIRINGTAEAFSLRVDFKRVVSFRANNKAYTRYEASTWDNWCAGTHAATPDYIMSQMDTLIDPFISDYIKANQK